MYRFQQRNWLQRQQLKEEEEREKARLSAEAAQKLQDAAYDALKQQYQQEKPSGLLFPTSYHMQKTVAPSAVPVLQQQFASTGLHHGQTQYAPNSYFTAVPVKQEIVDDSFALDDRFGANGMGDDIYSETSSLDQEFDFSGVPSATMSPFDTTRNNPSFGEGDVTANYLDFGDMETEDPHQHQHQHPHLGMKVDPSELPNSSAMSSPQSELLWGGTVTPNTISQNPTPTPSPSKPVGRPQTRAKTSATTTATTAAIPVGSALTPTPGSFKFDFSGGSSFSAPVSGTIVKLEDRRMSSE